MEIALFIIIIVLLIYFNSTQKKEIQNLRSGLRVTFDELKQIKERLDNKPSVHQDVTATTPPISNEIIDELEQEDSITIIEEEAIFIHEDNDFEQLENEIINESYRPTPVEQNTEHQEIEPQEPELSWFEKFKEKNPDLEKFIGENLINKIGIFILVLGISFFVRYAIAKEWINEPARVGIGILAGGILLAVAHRLRRKYKAFSSVLVSGAIAVFYFTIGIGFHEYELFSQTTAFIIMVAITIFSVFVSIAYDRQELGVLSTLAGFAVPFMVSTGEGNYHVLLTYIMILNVGMLTISFYKRWFIVNFTAFLTTIVIVLGWYTSLAETNYIISRNTLIYCTLLYLIFTIAFTINNVINKSKFAYYEISAIIATSALYYAIGCHIVQQINPNYLGLFTITLGLANIVLAYFIYRFYKFDKNIIYVIIGLALTLATITLPIQFEGNYITIFWACEAVLLFWLGIKSNMKGFILSGIIVQFLSIISLLIDMQFYANDTVPYVIGFNLQFLTALMVIGSLVYTYTLFLKHVIAFSYYELEFNTIAYRKIAFNVALVMAYLLPLIEIKYQANEYFYNWGTKVIFIYLYHMLFTTVLLYKIKDHSNPKIIQASNLLIIFNIVLYIITAYRLPIVEKIHNLYDEPKYPFAFNLHYISLALLIAQAWQYIKVQIFNPANKISIKSFPIWFISIFIVYLFSIETNIIYLFNTSNISEFHAEKVFTIKVVYPILWGLIAFGFLILGIKKQIKPIRIISLVLLSVTILKLFIYDIRDVSKTGQIVAFMLLGVLILVISFVYQRIKKSIVDNDEEAL